MPPVSRNSVSVILVGLSMALAGCAPAPETEVPAAPVPPPPPATEEGVEVAAPETPAAPETTGEEAHAHEGDDHDDHDHDDEHDHEHEDEVAHGEAHQHGLGVMAVSLLGETISVSLEAPLANFGLVGTTREPPVFDPPLTEIVSFPAAANCVANEVGIEIFGHGDHGNLVLTATFDCANIAGAKSLEFTGFDRFPGFEIVDVIYLTQTSQTAAELSPGNRVIILGE